MHTCSFIPKPKTTVVIGMGVILVVYSCLSVVVSFHVKENSEISCTKEVAMYGEWLVLHQVLADKLLHIYF